MVKGSVSAICALCSQLTLEDIVWRTAGHPFTHPMDIDLPINKSEIERVRQWLKIATHFANDFEAKAVHDRIDIIESRFKRAPISHRDLAVELRVLRETIDAALQDQLIYRYTDERAKFLRGWQDEWRSVLNSFPSADKDIFAGVDLWSLGHSTASVFHSMRVLEHGLRALASDLGKNFDIQNWQNIIDEIESEIRSLGKTLPRGLPKNERLQFLSEAAKEFYYFKDGWRNYVSHNRAYYDQHQARSVLEHVRAFMTALSSRLRESAP